MAFRAPTRIQLLLLFLILAPAVWSLSLDVLSYLGLVKEPFFKNGVFGFFFGWVMWWFFGLLMRWAWFFTWIPTVLAALASERALHFLCRRFSAPFAARAALIAVCSVTCGLIYAGVFAVSATLVAHQQVTAELGALSEIIISVGVTGAVLGAIIGAWPRLTPSTSAEQRPS